jgi:hypothetical protein
METTKEEVETFLRDFKQKMAARVGGYSVIFSRERPKNLQTQLDLELKEFEKEKYLSELTVEDFYKGPTQDVDGGPDLWEFGKMVKSKEMYIKISIGKLNKPVRCVSFHFPEREIKYPFKTKN